MVSRISYFFSFVLMFALLYLVISILFGDMTISYYNEKEFKKELKHEVTLLCEDAYFEGQRDVLNGDIRIEWRDSNWVWIKSPWNGGQQPILDLKKFTKEHYRKVIK